MGLSSLFLPVENFLEGIRFNFFNSLYYKYKIFPIFAY